MRNFLAVFFFLLSVLTLEAQIGLRPDFFVEQTNPTNSNFEVYSQKGGITRRASLNNLKKWVAPFFNPDTIAYTPTSSGNTTDLASFVYDPTGLLWYIDGQGNAVSFTTALGTDGNGLISALPLGDVSINASANTLSITNLDSIRFTAFDLSDSSTQELKLSPINSYMRTLLLSGNYSQVAMAPLAGTITYYDDTDTSYAIVQANATQSLIAFSEGTAVAGAGAWFKKDTASIGNVTSGIAAIEVTNLNTVTPNIDLLADTLNATLVTTFVGLPYAIDSVSYYGDTIRVYQDGNSTYPFKAEIIAGVTDSTVFATLYALADTASTLRGDFPTPDGNGIYGGNGALPSGGSTVDLNGETLQFDDNSAGGSVEWYIYDATDDASLVFDNDQYTIQIKDKTADQQGTIEVGTNYAGLYTDSTGVVSDNHIRVTPDGVSVGDGTSGVPTASLDVNGDLRIRTATQNDTLTKIAVLDYTTGLVKWRNASTLDTDSQTLSISNDSLSILGGNTVDIGYMNDTIKWNAINRCGFVDITETNISFSESTKIFTLAPVGASWSYFREGRYITVYDTVRVDLDTLSTTLNDGDFVYIVINNDFGILEISEDAWTLLDSSIPVAMVLWNSTLFPKSHFADERHQALMDRRTHAYLHLTQGVKVLSGGVPGDYDIAPVSPSNDGNTFSITQTELVEEDLFETLDPLADPAGNNGEGTYINFFHSAGDWVWDTSDMPFVFVAGSWIRYDNGTNLVTGQNNRYYNYYLIYTNFDSLDAYAMISGRSEFTSAANAYAENPLLFDWTGFPFKECVVAYQFTFYANTSYTNKGKCRLTRAPQRIGSTVTSITVPTGTIYTDAPISGVGSIGNPIDIANGDYGDIDVNESTWSLDSTITLTKTTEFNGTVQVNFSGDIASQAKISVTNNGAAGGGINAVGNSYGLRGSGTTTGVQALSSATPLQITNQSTANGLKIALDNYRTSITTANPGDGLSTNFYMKGNGTLTSAIVGRYDFLLQDTTTSSVDAAYDLYLMKANSLSRAMRIASTGQLTLDGYAYTGLTSADSSVYVLTSDNTGDVYKRAATTYVNTDAQTLSTSRDTITISTGNSVRTPGVGFLRDSITGAALTIDLKKYGQAVVVVKMESATNCTLTVNNPWSDLTDNSYPTFEGEIGVYTFHFIGSSGTDNITWPAAFLDMGGTGLGTDAITAGTAYTCYYDPVAAKYYCK